MAAKKEDLLKQEGIIEILSAILGLEVNTLSKLERTILNGVLIEGKTFKMMQETTKLTSTRQTAVFKNGINRLIKDIKGLDNKVRNFDKLAGELYQAQDLVDSLNRKLKITNSFSASQQKILNLPISESGMSARVINACDYANIRKISDLARLTKFDFLKFRNAGKKGLDEIEAFFFKNDLSWQMEL